MINYQKKLLLCIQNNYCTGNYLYLKTWIKRFLFSVKNCSGIYEKNKHFHTENYRVVLRFAYVFLSAGSLLFCCSKCNSALISFWLSNKVQLFFRLHSLCWEMTFLMSCMKKKRAGHFLMWPFYMKLSF